MTHWSLQVAEQERDARHERAVFSSNRAICKKRGHNWHEGKCLRCRQTKFTLKHNLP